jgi:hypothetical protein
LVSVGSSWRRIAGRSEYLLQVVQDSWVAICV